jgi:hypothetical protein
MTLAQSYLAFRRHQSQIRAHGGLYMEPEYSNIHNEWTYTERECTVPTVDQAAVYAQALSVVNHRKGKSKPPYRFIPTTIEFEGKIPMILAAVFIKHLVRQNEEDSFRYGR